jgi:hypothetical protein
VWHPEYQSLLLPAIDSVWQMAAAERELQAVNKYTSKISLPKLAQI